MYERGADKLGPELMREQLTHILQVAQQPNVTIQVVPFASGAHPSFGRPFLIFSFPGPDDPDIVYLHDTVTAVCIQDPVSTRRYRQLFSERSATALEPAESTAIIQVILEATSSL